MRNAERHLADEEILLAMDRELRPKRARRARKHLATCEECRARMEKMARASEALDELRGRTEPVLPPMAGARALLKARLVEIGSRAPTRSWFRGWTSSRELAYASVLILLVGLGGLTLGMRHRSGAHSVLPDNDGILASALPQPNLTPGAVRRVTVADVCRAPDDGPQEVPVALQREVFHEYRLRNVRVADYELDYLITPELGGADDIRNLWPEPHYSIEWNSYVKDDLENYLHQLVCSGKLDLPTAQRDIATDWISAYKKYFHTDVPLAEHEGRRTSSRGLPRT